MSAPVVEYVDAGSGAHVTAADLTDRCPAIAVAIDGPMPVVERCTKERKHAPPCVDRSGFKLPAKARREAQKREDEYAQRDKVAAFFADRLAREAWKRDEQYDAAHELRGLSNFRDLAGGDLVDGRTFNELRAIAAAWKLCGWDIRPHELTERQIREVLHRGLVPQFKETARGLEAVFSRAKGGAR